MRELLGEMIRLPMSMFLFGARQVVMTLERWLPAAVEPAGQREPKREIRSVALGAWPATESKEEWNVADTNLNDKDIKLVEYSIISIERRKERILDRAENEDGSLGTPLLYLETGRVTGDGFSNARIADWVKRHPEEAKRIDLGALRVYYNVVERWPEGDLKYEEKQLDIEEEKLGYLRKLAGT